MKPNSEEAALRRRRPIIQISSKDDFHKVQGLTSADQISEYGNKLGQRPMMKKQESSIKKETHEECSYIQFEDIPPPQQQQLGVIEEAFVQVYKPSSQHQYRSLVKTITFFLSQLDSRTAEYHGTFEEIPSLSLQWINYYLVQNFPHLASSTSLTKLRNNLISFWNNQRQVRRVMMCGRWEVTPRILGDVALPTSLTYPIFHPRAMKQHQTQSISKYSVPKIQSTAGSVITISSDPSCTLNKERHLLKQSESIEQQPSAEELNSKPQQVKKMESQPSFGSSFTVQNQHTGRQRTVPSELDTVSLDNSLRIIEESEFVSFKRSRPCMVKEHLELAPKLQENSPNEEQEIGMKGRRLRSRL